MDQLIASQNEMARTNISVADSLNALCSSLHLNSSSPQHFHRQQRMITEQPYSTPPQSLGKRPGEDIYHDQRHGYDPMQATYNNTTPNMQQDFAPQPMQKSPTLA